MISWLEAWGYRYVEVPTLMPKDVFTSCTEGTENRMFELNKNTVLIPEVTNYIRMMGSGRLGCNKVYYVAKCFRNETNIGAERLREFTQIGVEFLGDNALDCRKVVRRDAINLFKKLLPPDEWVLEDGVERGLNLYDDSGKTFEVSSPRIKKQLLGGGPYEGGAGWALGLERMMLVMKDI
jgi:ATP phosphoribosyltransferase regulatory subunit HisZ